MNSFENHYRDRVNSPYQAYFEKRYDAFLRMCSGFDMIKEEGIGIGSVSKALRNRKIHCYGSDVSEEMLNMCRKNVPGLFCFKEDMINRMDVTLQLGTQAVVTHGVLEHFTNDEIHLVLEMYKNRVDYSIHYVPTDLYNKPSVGDERLMPWRWWVETFKPCKFQLFNKCHDLTLVFNHRKK
jgi:hypothetical protein